ncbi:MAG: hypothetical protein A2W00_04650 [Candidatus Eisenbacteria bacterium RBG_16_71_46]|nr:MAG: hypothetical protein A2W00_04650 [Candidatus Eisenbacteria bacterium RBG_16_71_46]
MQARECLILHYRYLVILTTCRFTGGHPVPLDREDLVSAGFLGLVRAVDRYATLEAEAERVRAQSRELLTALQADYDSLMYRFGGELEHWTQEEIARRGGRRKSVITLQGTLALRTVPRSLRIADEQAAFAYAREQGMELITSLNRQAYNRAAKTALEETGELLPGMETTPEHETFSIRFGKDKGGSPVEE